MYGVIALHSVNTNNVVQTGYFPILPNILYNLGVISMPIFFMVSGFLLMGKDITRSYVAKKVISILKFTSIISLSFAFLYLFFGSGITFKKILLLFPGCLVQKGQFSVFWYFGALIIIYMILLPLNTLYLRHKILYNRILLLFLFLCLGVCIANYYFASTENYLFEQSIPQVLRLYTSIFYFMLGGFYKQYESKINNLLIVNFKTFCILLIVLLATIFSSNKIFDIVYCEYFYTYPICIITVFVFFVSVLKKFKTINVSVFSNLFLPVYATHIFVIQIARKLVNVTDFNVIFFYIGICVVTTAISYIIMKTPVIKNIFKI